MKIVSKIRYSYRLRPGAKALAEWEAEWHRCRWLWNEAVHMQRTGQRPTFKKLSALLTGARARISWLADGSSVAQNQMLRTYDKALHDSFSIKGRGRPKLKKKNIARPSLQYTTTGFYVKGTTLHLPHGIKVPIVFSRSMPSKPTSVRVYQDSIGHWYASFVVLRDPVMSPPPDQDSEIGIDWGIKVTATTTNSTYDLPYQGHRKKCAAELAKAQRKMARRRTSKGHLNTKGYNKARQSTAKVYKKAQRQSQHTGRRWAKVLVDNHQFIAVEDFKPKFMFKFKFARKAADASIGTIKRVLIEIAEQQGRTVVKVPPAYTTMTCSSCFARAKQHLELSDRVFLCWSCGHKQNRDRNAAYVVLAFAKATQAGLNLASADGVRRWQALRSPTKQPELGIPRLLAVGRTSSNLPRSAE